jgi:hypothetical protein
MNGKRCCRIGIITLEDAETGEQIEINTADRTTRARFTDLANEGGTNLADPPPK